MRLLMVVMLIFVPAARTRSPAAPLSVVTPLGCADTTRPFPAGAIVTFEPAKRLTSPDRPLRLLTTLFSCFSLSGASEWSAEGPALDARAIKIKAVAKGAALKPGRTCSACLLVFILLPFFFG